MRNATLRRYRALRATGLSARHSLSSARTLEAWERLEDAGLVRLDVRPDDSYDWDDAEERERFGNDGAWGLVGEYRLSEDDKWEHGDSCWGFVGYRDVTSPTENAYVPDIMSETVDALRVALKSRCPVCRQVQHAA
jgi:hypothetical protein